MFPNLQGQDALVDYKDLPDATASSHVKLARWHHAQAFVDLRRLVAPGKAPDQGPQLEFRAYLTQVSQVPPRSEYPEADWSTAFAACRSYVKGVISLDRPLQRLCPRDVRPAEQPSGEPYIPPPPPKRPAPTVNEELEKEAEPSSMSRAHWRMDMDGWSYEHVKGW
eukprot:Skav234947  [mRNA]  locus=scaffold2817:84438:86675:- [translate_table: standard]